MVKENNISWEIKDDTLFITGDGVIPDGGSEDTEWENKDFSKIVIGEGITHIGKGAFKGCDKLKDITIPESVSFIDTFAFEGCKLREIDVHASKNSIIYFLKDIDELKSKAPELLRKCSNLQVNSLLEVLMMFVGMMIVIKNENE